MNSAEEILGRKYATEALVSLTAGEQHFNELKETLHLPTSKTLSGLLKVLVSEGLLARTEQVKNRVTYALTEKGRELVKVIEMLRAWERKWDGGVT